MIKKLLNIVSLKGKGLFLIQNDATVYRLLLIGLLIASPSLHYLCSYNSYDPFWLRLISCFFCLAALSFSFLGNKVYYKISVSLTITSFLLINNCILLGKNGFEHVYLFSAITVFIALTLFCKKRLEFVLISEANLAAIVTAYFTAPKLAISPTVLVVLIVIFTLIAYLSFLVVMAYQYQLKSAVDNVMKLNQNLVVNDAELRESRKHLNALINSLNDIIFEFDETKTCINVWFNEMTERPVNPRIAIGKTLDQVVGPEKAEKYDRALNYVIETRKPISIEFDSDFDSGHSFTANFTPIFEQSSGYTGRISASVVDITGQKKYERKLKENEDLLLEAQNIARIGNWWYDHETKETFWSANLNSLLEIENPPEGVSRFQYYISMVHPDDRDDVFEYLNTIRTTPQSKIEHKFITPAGNLKYIRIQRGERKLSANAETRTFGIIQDITEARLADKAVKLSQLELMEAQAIAKIGNWKYDVASRHISWSEELNNIFEHNRQTSSCHRCFVKLLLKHAHPNDRPIIRQMLRSNANTMDSSYEYRIVTPAGHIKHVSIIAGKRLYNEDGSVRKIIGTLQDITERKTAEIDFRTAESKYRQVLETINMAAITIDDNGYVTFCNRYLANLLGYTQTEIIGMNWMDHLIPEDLKDYMKSWFANNAILPHYINPVICRNGERRIINWQNTIFYDENGKIKEVTALGEDITDQEKARQDLIWAKEVAEKSSKFKSEFLSIMSHEIRTPMNAVIGTTNLLLSENPRAEQMDYLNTLKFSGESLLAIINDILDYNKIEAGKLELNHSRFDVQQLIQKIKQQFIHRATEKQLALDVIIDGSIPAELMGDAMRLSQILNNLVSNAIKFTHKGGVTIRLDRDILTESTVSIKFAVTDTGIGISPESFNIVFDPFMQDQQVINNDYGGTGLGLAITKRLVELHKGTISVSSELSKGTTFNFTISFALAPGSDIPAQPAVPMNITDHNLQGLNILVVDDNKMNLMIAAKFLKRWNAQVAEAINGRIAVDMVNANNYDLIIMDLQMPVMDGFEATAVIKVSHPDLPIIALTADAMPETYEKALAAGMVDYLTKPFVPEVLYAKLAKHLKQPAQF
ncbi:PAS domain-containing hybrid sensor histidine kinase/response regulator [Mucilaginibacter celer]|uniref:histidine kinase n=1 Tax=Mucilaginibacter celer TaxID=2305508 RepID=A0A494VTM5_9SPHI|nr:PAS domain-containing hybrid sensor histidine kinase/response regulator [Mucilaginibacter celer]AYL94748.1 PAS domain S-box protein [Mucilaginibacter celer]